jgi:hypothetical protein
MHTENKELKQELSRYVSASEAGDIIGVSGQRVGVLRGKSDFPKPCVRWGKVLFRRAEIVKWKESHGR